ncbi:MAG: Uma2 family endonuclease [Nitrospirae bacterium]|nr:MAG: Uma2 family endonuclease [Nitrospirota bacterium]
MNTTIRFTYQDYLQLPEDRQYEIVDGDLYMVPAPTPYHQQVSRNLEFPLHQYVKAHDLGEVFYAPCDVLLSETDVVQPDLLFIAKARLSIITDTHIQGAPDLVIEILSPASEPRDRGAKQKLYARAGVSEYWIVDPMSKTVEVFRLSETGYHRINHFTHSDTLHSPTFPDLAIPLSDIF